MELILLMVGQYVLTHYLVETQVMILQLVQMELLNQIMVNGKLKVMFHLLLKIFLLHMVV